MQVIAEDIVPAKSPADDTSTDAEAQSEKRVPSHATSLDSVGRAQEAKLRLKDIILRNKDLLRAHKSDAQTQNVDDASPHPEIHRHFPHLNKETLFSLENMIRHEGKYIVANPTFLNFLRLNFGRFKIDTKRERLRQFSIEDLLVVGLLSSALLLSTPARGHLNSLAGLIINTDPTVAYSPTRHGELLYVTSVITAVGRLVTGFIIDSSDPIHTFFIFALFSAVTVVFIANLHQITPDTDPIYRYNVLVALMAFNVFFQSGIQASGIRYLHDHFRPSLYGRALVVFAIGGRCGSIISSTAMGSVVSSPNPYWPTGSTIAYGMCFGSLVPLVLLKLFPHPAVHLAAADEEEFLENIKTHAATAPPRSLINIGFPSCGKDERKRRWRHTKKAAKRLISWWQRRSFVLIACANAGMAVAISGEGFDGLASLFTGRVFHIPSGLPTASVTIFTQLGAIASLLFGGFIIERFDRPSQARANLIMVMIACFAAIGLIGLSVEGQNSIPATPNLNLAPSARAVYFFMGFGLGYPFSVTVQKFSLNFGGAHAALVTQSLGILATAVCAVADGIFGTVAYTSFPAVGIILASFIFFAWLSFLLFDFFEWSSKVKLKNFDITAKIAKMFHGADLDNAATDRKRMLLLAERESFSRDVSGMLDKRTDATHLGLHYAWTIVTFLLAASVVVGLFISYTFVNNPGSLF